MLATFLGAVPPARTVLAGEAGPKGTIAFSSLAPRGWDVYLIDVESRASRRLTDHPALDFNAAFDPRGERVAFVSERDGNAELYAVGVDGSGLRRLTRRIRTRRPPGVVARRPLDRVLEHPPAVRDARPGLERGLHHGGRRFRPPAHLAGRRGRLLAGLVAPG